MAKATKLTPAQKIQNAIANLNKTSQSRAEIAQGFKILESIKTVDENGNEVSGNAELERMLKNAKIRYDVDVEYLRKNIIYNCGKLTEEMSDTRFDAFANKLLELI